MKIQKSSIIWRGVLSYKHKLKRLSYCCYSSVLNFFPTQKFMLRKQGSTLKWPLGGMESNMIDLPVQTY